MNTVAKCPRCRSKVIVELLDLDPYGVNGENTEDADCDNCGASLAVGCELLVKVRFVEIEEEPFVKYECPKCETENRVDNIVKKSGTINTECEACEAQLRVTWSNWHEHVGVDVRTAEDDLDS